ncbi:hypothetical protein BDY24DRAFT_413952 [Mrakia frigida]|uniref:uncharacterized protein n=1 Tax=Mrakia frigida TaxID=29902 RepID=UPI003FCC030B
MRFLLLLASLTFIASILSLSVSAASLPLNAIYFRAETPDQPSYRDYIEHQESQVAEEALITFQSLWESASTAWDDEKRL